MQVRRVAARALKRGIDVGLSAALLITLSPLLAAIAAALALTEGRPVLFRQRRPGLHGVPFEIVKFRTMRPARPGAPGSDADRVTRLGRLLRTTSLDELPELWNVLRGDMSLVGPRPLLVEYLDWYTPSERRRHAVRPGVTGWAVVNGRNRIPFRERLALDVWYVDHWSLGLDLRILGRTAWQVIRRADASVTEDDAALGFPRASDRSLRIRERPPDGEPRPGEAPPEPPRRRAEG